LFYDKKNSMKKFYLPGDESGIYNWYTNFAAKLPDYAADLDISPATVAQVQKNAAALKAIILYQISAKSFAESVIDYKIQLMKGEKPLGNPPQPPAPLVLPAGVENNAIGNARKLVRWLKAHKNYKSAMGILLGVEGSEVNKNLATWKPVLKSKLVARVPVIQWKKGYAEGIQLFVDRNDGKGFQFLCTDTKPPYMDKHPLPQAGKGAVWTYKGIFIMNDEPVGLYSQLLEVAVSG